MKQIKIIKTLSIIIVSIFIILPLFGIIKYMSYDGLSKLEIENILSATINSVKYSSISSILSIIFGLICAYLLSISNIKNKNIFVTLLNIPLLIPSLSIGLGTKLLLNNNGFIDKLFNINLTIETDILLIICSTICVFPIAFNNLYDGLQYENKQLLIVSDTLNVDRFLAFIKLTLPSLKTSIIYSFFTCFSIIFSDYGIPMEIAGHIKTLPLMLYEYITASLDYSKASIIMIILSLPSTLLHIFNFKFHSKQEEQTNYNYSIKNLSIVTKILLSIILIIMLLPIMSFVLLSFIKSFPNDLSFTFGNIVNIFNISVGLGFTNYLFNSILIAILTAIIGTAVSFILAYLSVRSKDKLSIIIDSLANLSLCLPGMVLGISYVLSFSNLFIYRTIFIIVIVNICHSFGSPYLLLKSALSKLDSNYENVAKTLNISKLSLIIKVFIPLLITSLLESISYLFVTAMTTSTAVIFIASYNTQTLATLIPYFEKTLNYEMQAVVSTFILIINILFKGGMLMLKKLFRQKKTISETNIVKRAIILAAGFGSRMQPLTFTTAKPMLKINDKPIIETIIENLLEKDITEIIIVTGYKNEQFNYLIDKYNVKLLVNDKYSSENNISSLYVAKDYLDRCYICEADLVLTNNVFDKYESKTCFFGFKCNSSEDWCAKINSKGYISSFKIGGKDVYQTCGISYWNYYDAKILKQNLEKLYNSHGGKQSLWDMAAFNKNLKKINVSIKEIHKSDIIELDTVEDYNFMISFDKK